MAWEAKYRGECGACGQWFEVGTQVRWGEGRTIVEEHCSIENLMASLPDPEEARKQMCTKCWLVHAKGQVSCD